MWTPTLQWYKNHSFFIPKKPKQSQLSSHFQTQRWISTIVHDPAAPPEEVSLTFYLYDIFSSTEEGMGEQWSLACKEICTETSHCEQSCFWQGNTGI